MGIFGDYDVDGITSCAMWYKFLGHIGIETVIYIPNRCDGYGISSSGLDYLIDAGADCILARNFADG